MPKLVAKGGRPFRAGRTVLWATSWGLGAGLGVAAGAWLTVVGEASAPGIEAIDPGVDLLALPAASFLTVSLAHLAGQWVAALVRGRQTSAARQSPEDRDASLG